MKQLIMKAYGPEGYEEYEFAVVHLSDELIKAVLQRRKILLAGKAKDDQVYKVLFWDTFGPLFFQISIDDPEPDCLGTQHFIGHNWDITETEFEPDDAHNTECEQMVVTDEKVGWIVVPKHSDHYVSTEMVPIEELDKLLGKV